MFAKVDLQRLPELKFVAAPVYPYRTVHHFSNFKEFSCYKNNSMNEIHPPKSGMLIAAQDSMVAWSTKIYVMDNVINFVNLCRPGDHDILLLFL